MLSDEHLKMVDFSLLFVHQYLQVVILSSEADTFLEEFDICASGGMLVWIVF